MKITKLVVLVSSLFVFNFAFESFASDINWQNISQEHLNLKAVLVGPNKPASIYIGSDKGIFKSEDGGLNWRNILLVRGQKKCVNFLLFAPQNEGVLYAATGDGLFYSGNAGKNWDRIFKGKNSLENECTTLSVLSNTIYLGTKGGLFVTKDKGRSWHKENTKLGNSHILAIAYSLKEPDCIYVACVDGVFNSKDNGQSWERIFITHPVENGNDEEEVAEDQDEEGRFSKIRYINIDPNNASYLCLATSKGLYKSQDRGRAWEAVSSYGLLSQDIRFLLFSPQSEIYAIAKSGIFEYKDGRWHELSFSLAAGEIRFLALDNQNNLYAACEKGLFKAGITYSSDDGRGHTISLYYKDEPEINEVQQAAIKYAEVEPKKIARWREQAAKKAFLPKVTAGVNRDTSDLWHWESGSTTKACDDVLVRGRDTVGWDVTLTWDLSEFIWNDDQTNIDVRSRLMVQLRDDILDEVTKLYFERLRVKMELDNLSIEDRKKRFEKELRLQELTASIDALTGGYFSQELKSKTGS